ncbi:MAG: hypothetical protein IJQ54_02455 [Kiritimatiellae bacterium]|nr:hypothetical protein [Kiritimatiellia bacterium]MBR0241368.1 hypothetical protein [Kiritimatiellia bacterium]
MWEELYNPDFKPLGFEGFRKKEFQRLKAKEQELIGWSAKRELAKIDYHPIER